MAIFRRKPQALQPDDEHLWRVDKMRRQYNAVQRPHPKNNPDFERMAVDAHYRVQIQNNLPDGVVLNS